MRLSRNEFKQKIQQLESAMTAVDEMERVTKFCIVNSPLFSVISNFMAFLSDMCDIPKNCFADSALSYYVYDLDFGRKYTPGCIENQNGTICQISNPDELYDDLCKSWGEYKKQ